MENDKRDGMLNDGPRWGEIWLFPHISVSSRSLIPGGTLIS